MKSQRLYGRRLKTSNEQLLLNYGNLAKYAVGKYARAFRLTHDQAEDLLHSLLVEIFRAPRQYRNLRGISILIGSRIKDFQKGFTKGSLCRNTEVTVGLMQSPAVNESLRLKGRVVPSHGEDPPDPQNHEQMIHDSIAVPSIFVHLDALASSERAVLGLSFGIDGHREMSDAMIAIKLGRP